MTDIFQIDTSDVDLSDEKFDCHYDGEEDDTFQASMIALHGSTCSADLTYQTTEQGSTPQVSVAKQSILAQNKCFNLDILH